VTSPDGASLDYQEMERGGLRLLVDGTLNAENTGRLWNKIVRRVGRVKPETLEIDARNMESCDAAGFALLLELKARQDARRKTFRIEGMRKDLAELMDLFDPGPPPTPDSRPGMIRRGLSNIGEATWTALSDLHAQVSFTGEIFVKLLGTIFHPGRLRLGDTLVVVEKAGAKAIGITALLGFLIGLILAFQSAIAMRKFGAEIYVADLVAIALFRELGPLITAFVLASRSGSAFAAELGTMKVNEEIDALVTMGLDPVQFLAVPRLIAGVLVMPLLTMFNNLFGLIGCGLVMLSFGFPLPTYLDQIRAAASLGDLFGGLVKTLVFGFLIAGIGCLRGLQTGNSPSAVGDSATRAVVSGIVAIVIADGVFAVVYYYMGI